MADHSELFLHLSFIYLWGCFILDLRPWTIITESGPKNAFLQIVEDARIRQVAYYSIISAIALHIDEDYGRNVFSVGDETYHISTAVACVRFYCIVRFFAAILVVSLDYTSEEYVKVNTTEISSNPPIYEESMQESALS